jgi:hypothetical protein
MPTRILKGASGVALMFVAALIVGLCQDSLAQGDLDLEVPGLESWPAPSKGAATLFQNVRIFDGKTPTLSESVNVLVTSVRPSSAYRRLGSQLIRALTCALSQGIGVCLCRVSSTHIGTPSWRLPADDPDDL